MPSFRKIGVTESQGYHELAPGVRVGEFGDTTRKTVFFHETLQTRRKITAIYVNVIVIVCLYRMGSPDGIWSYTAL
jgi:hypothetical protein